MGTASPSRRLVIVGAGTGVGKTHLGVALAHALARRGDAVVALKPIESGVEAGTLSDTAQLTAASTFHVKHPPPFVFSEPVSPHLAARRAGVAIDLGPVAAWVEAHDCPWVLVETAGGLLSPLGQGVTNLDLARAVQPDAVLLVAQDRLGVLHEVSACCLVLRVLAPEMGEVVVVLQTPPASDLSTGTNATELATLGIVEHAFTVPRGAPAEPAVGAAVAELAEHLHRRLASPDVSRET